MTWFLHFHQLKSTDVEKKIADWQVRADIPEQNYGGNVQIYCMLPKAGPKLRMPETLTDGIFLKQFECIRCLLVFFVLSRFVSFCFLHIGSLQKFGKSLHCLQLMWLTLPRHVRPLLLFPQSYQALRASRQSAPSERWKTSTCLKILATHHVLAKHGQVWCGPQIWRLFLATFRLWMDKGKNAAIIHWKLVFLWLIQSFTAITELERPPGSTSNRGQDVT